VGSGIYTIIVIGRLNPVTPLWACRGW